MADTKNDQLDEIYEREEEDLAQILAERYKLPYINLAKISIDLDAMKLVTESDALAAKLVVFHGTGRKLKVGIKTPNLNETKEQIKGLENKGYQVEQFIVSENSLKRAWKQYIEIQKYEATSKGSFDISEESINQIVEQNKGLEELKNDLLEIVNAKEKRKVSEILEIILAGAILSGASDIHLEPQETQARLRWRLDGVLHDFVSFDLATYDRVLMRIKLLSGMKLNIKNQAQDGRFSIKFKDMEIEIRTSLIPEPAGEAAVMRILNPQSISVPVESLGIEPYLLSILNKEMSKPHGMILTTGPTGSGKTTALYAFLKKVYTPEVKIITLEDPIEYHVTGIVQTQINDKGGYTFASGLRAILRQDPDIIMVGEIRDSETAKTAVNAALTGHLVLSTLHTNNAAGVIPRLLDLGVEPNILPPALNIAMAQRLVRKLCEACKAPKEATENEKATIKKIVESIPPNFPDHPRTENIKLFKPIGCPACRNIGYKGRIGIFEAILLDEGMAKLIAQKPGEAEVMKEAYRQGMATMQQDGIIKVLRGVTDLEELSRVVEL